MEKSWVWLHCFGLVWENLLQLLRVEPVGGIYCNLWKAWGTRDHPEEAPLLWQPPMAKTWTKSPIQKHFRRTKPILWLSNLANVVRSQFDEEALTSIPNRPNQMPLPYQVWGKVTAPFFCEDLWLGSGIQKIVLNTSLFHKKPFGSCKQFRWNKKPACLLRASEKVSPSHEHN